jgi:hypothetical protein
VLCCVVLCCVVRCCTNANDKLVVPPVVASAVTGHSFKRKLKFSLCLTKHHAMKTYCGVKVQRHAFLTSVPEGQVQATINYKKKCQLSDVQVSNCQGLHHSAVLPICARSSLHFNLLNDIGQKWTFFQSACRSRTRKVALDRNFLVLYYY